jgi:hypothetical protein
MQIFYIKIMNDIICPSCIDSMHILEPYEEVVGRLLEVSSDRAFLIARFGKISIGLPLEMDNLIRPLVGQEIKILRTDLPQKQYLIRTSSSQSACIGKSSKWEGMRNEQ